MDDQTKVELLNSIVVQVAQDRHFARRVIDAALEGLALERKILASRAGQLDLAWRSALLLVDKPERVTKDLRVMICKSLLPILESQVSRAGCENGAMQKMRDQVAGEKTTHG